MSIKNEKINSNILREISYIISNEIKDPEIKFVTITYVDTTSDLSYCKVYFTTLSDVSITLKALKNAKGFIRKELASRVELRHVPQLEFIYDTSIEYGKKIEEKIKELNEGNN